MAVIIKRDEDGNPVFNTLSISDEEKKRAMELDKILSKEIPEIEGEWTNKRIKKGKGRKIDMVLAYKIGRKLRKIVDDESLVYPNERRWVWKAIREMYLKGTTFKKREESRDDLEYLYRASKFPFSFLKNLSWDSWRRLLDSPSLQADKRFDKWLQNKAKATGMIQRGFLRRFSKILYSQIKNKDTGVLSDNELFYFYESAWKAAQESIMEK